MNSEKFNHTKVVKFNATKCDHADIPAVKGVFEICPPNEGMSIKNKATEFPN